MSAFTAVAFARDGRPLDFDNIDPKIPEASNELEEVAAKNTRIVRPARNRPASIRGSCKLPGL